MSLGVVRRLRKMNVKVEMKKETGNSIGFAGRNGGTMGGVAENQLYALTKTEEESCKIAELYDIILIEYKQGVATYHTEKNPHEVVKLGEKKKYPPIYINYLNHML